MSLALMKMEVLGIEKVERTWVTMDTEVDGQGWVVDLMTAPRNGRRLYVSPTHFIF